MGFNLYNLGLIKPCWVENGNVCYELTGSGTILRCPTRLQKDIPRQLNLFMSKTVAFLLYDDESMYIGRYDGVISIYDRETEILTGLNNWDAPAYPPLKVCGYYRSPVQLCEINLDLRDKVTAYVNYNSMEAVLTTPINVQFEEELNLVGAEIEPKIGSVSIYNERGEEIEIKTWSVQNDVWRQNCRVFL